LVLIIAFFLSAVAYTCHTHLSKDHLILG
jgi:hypothetical protein